MTTFNAAHEVRAHLKAQGIATKVKIKWSDNPFGGSGKFQVTPEVPAGSTVIHASSSIKGEANGVFSDNKTAADIYGNLEKALKDTNARVS